MQVPNIAASAKRFCIEVFTPQGDRREIFNDARHLQMIPDAGVIMFEDEDKIPHSYQGFLYHVAEIPTPSEESEPTSKLIVGG